MNPLEYRGWKERLNPAWFACWPIARTGLQLVLRRKLFWLLLGLALLTFIFMFSAFYLKAMLITNQPKIAPFLSKNLSWLDGEKAEIYRDFMKGQSTVTMLLLAFAGSMLAGNDHRRGGLTFYLSRRINVFHYATGKLLAIGLLVSLTTTIPALVLFVQYGLLIDTETFFRNHIGLVGGILGYGFLMAAVLSLVLVALASWVPRPAPLVISWACLFLFLPLLAQILRRVYSDRDWLLLILWRDIELMGNWCFGLDNSKMLPHASAIVILVCIVASIAIAARVTAARNAS